MTRLAVRGDPLFDVDELELRRAGPSYTIDTVTELTLQGITSIYWLIGADMLMYLPFWHQATELLTKVTFIVMARPGWAMDWDMLPVPFRQLRANVTEGPLISITATDIRRRIMAGLPIRYLVPGAVEDYIREHELYR